MADKVGTLLSLGAVIALAVFAFTALYVAALDALAERNGHGWGSDGEYRRRYDLRTVCGISGEVVRVEKFAPRHGICRGVYLVVRNGSEDLLVALGPAWFVDAQEESFAAGDPAVGQRDGAAVASRRRSVAAPPLYQTDLERHLWSWEGHRTRA